MNFMPLVDDPEDIHPLDRMGQAMEADASDPSCWSPEDHVINHIAGSFLKVVESTYEANEAGCEDEVKDYISRALGAIYKRIIFPPTDTETTLGQAPATVFMLEIEAEFWYRSKRVELIWSVFAGDPNDQEARDHNFEWADDEVDTDTLIASGKRVYVEENWPEIQTIIHDVIHDYRNQMSLVF